MNNKYCKICGGVILPASDADAHEMCQRRQRESAASSRMAVATETVVHWAQAVLTALNVGDIKSGSPLHLKLRETMIAYRGERAAVFENVELSLSDPEA